MSLMSSISKCLFYPAWELKDGSQKLQTLKELERTQWLPENELRQRQWKKLIEILEYAYINCSYYKNKFDAIGIKPSAIKEESDFARIPVLSKKDIQINTEAMLSGLYKKSELVEAKTGGSTGKALKCYFDTRCQELRNAAAFRSDRWAGWELGDKRAALWGNPPTHDTLKKKIRNLLIDRTIYLDTIGLNEKSMFEFIELYRRYKPTVIFGHSHSIYMLALFIEKEKIEGIRPDGIISTSMMLLPHERELIEKVLKCKVTNRYGCEEVGLIGSECKLHNGLHMNIDHLYVEFIRDDGSAALPGESGSIVVTDLINRGMPLIRYKIEDVGVRSDRKCPCGRGLPLMEKVTGRVADFLIKRDGTLVAGVSLIERTLTAIPGIEQMQIVQEEVDRIILNIVPDDLYDKGSETAIKKEFSSFFGNDVVLEINRVENIPQDRSGKYRFAICKISQKVHEKNHNPSL